MSTEHELLAAVWAAPHDDTPRLVYADWLEKTGEPSNIARAEFIRVQCERERLGLDNETPEALPLKRREQQLWTANRAQWQAGLPADVRRSRFDCGFPIGSRGPLSPGRFAVLRDVELASAPAWSFIVTCTGKADDACLTTSPALGRAFSLVLRGDVHPGVLRALASSPFAAGLDRLQLPTLESGADALGKLLSSSAMPRLRYLGVAGPAVTADSLEAVVDGSLAASLTGLLVECSSLTPAALQRFIGRKRAPRLKLLMLHEDPSANDAVVEAMADAPWAAGVRELAVIIAPDVGDRAAAAIAQRLTGLTGLRLIGCNVGASGAARLARAPFLPQLRRLDLSFCPAAEDVTVVGRLKARLGRRMTAEAHAAVEGDAATTSLTPAPPPRRSRG